MKKIVFLLSLLTILLTSCDSGSSSGNQTENWSYVPSPMIESYVVCDQYGNPNDYGDYLTDGYNISFKGRNSDGFIHKGKVTLYSIGGISKTFYLFNKGGVNYAAQYWSGPFYSLSNNYVTIDNIKYKTR